MIPTRHSDHNCYCIDVKFISKSSVAVQLRSVTRCALKGEVLQTVTKGTSDDSHVGKLTVCYRQILKLAVRHQWFPMNMVLRHSLNIEVYAMSL